MTRRALSFGIPLSFLILACVTRLADDDRNEVEFWSQISTATEAEVEALDEAWRAILVETLPEARSVLEPLADRVRMLADQEIDAGVRAELLTPEGDAQLRQLILSTMDNALAAR